MAYDERMRNFLNRTADTHVRNESPAPGRIGNRGLALALAAIAIVLLVAIVAIAR